MKALLAILAFGVSMIGCNNSAKNLIVPLPLASKPVPLMTDPDEFILSSAGLTESQVSDLEHKLRDNPGDLTTRVQLQAYYMRHIFGDDTTAMARYEENALWVIKNAPDSTFAGSHLIRLYCPYGSQAYAEAERLWDSNLGKQPENLKILGNAASFFLILEPERSETYLKLAASIEPDNSDWPERLARLYSLAMGSSEGNERKAYAREALNQLDAKTRIAGDQPELADMVDSARYAFESGDIKRAALDCESALVRVGTSAETYPDEFHHVHLMLGRIALRGGDIKLAGNHLLKAADVPDSPVLSTFGPNMMLAKELLEKGDKAVVLKYFAACAKFWPDESLKDWKKEVKRGVIPDFGANENY